MKNKLVAIFIVIVTIMGIGLCNNYVYAGEDQYGGTTGGSSTGETTINPDDYKPDSATRASDATSLQNIGNIIVGVLQVIGTVASVAVLAILGIKYMIGSVEERAEYKKSMVPYLVGAVMVFGITTVLGIITSISGSLF